jgi:AcrR family transcriptional regulator
MGAPTKNKKDKLMGKAVQLFLTHGYEKTTMRDLARAVGIKAPGIYYYFKSKKDILYQINQDSWEKFQGMILRETKKIADPEEKIKLYICNMIKYQFELGQKTLILDDSPPLRYLRERKAQERAVFDFLRDTLQELARNKGTENTIDPTLGAFTLYSMVARIYRWYNPKGKITLEELGDQMTRFFFQGFYGGKLTKGKN